MIFYIVVVIIIEANKREGERLMKLCKNGKSIRMGFIIRRKADGQEVADVCAVIPIDKMDDPYFWWVYGVNAYLHANKLPTHPGERNRYTATPTAEYSVRHRFVREALAQRAAEPKKSAAKKKKTKRAAKKEYQPTFPPGCCQRCGYLDPQAAFGVKCPHCDYQEY